MTATIRSITALLALGYFEIQLGAYIGYAYSAVGVIALVGAVGVIAIVKHGGLAFKDYDARLIVVLAGAISVLLSAANYILLVPAWGLSASNFPYVTFFTPTLLIVISGFLVLYSSRGLLPRAHTLWASFASMISCALAIIAELLLVRS